MPYKHPTDRQAYNRRYYLEHREEMRERDRAYYAKKRLDPEWMKKRRDYHRVWRLKKTLGF